MEGCLLPGEVEPGLRGPAAVWATLAPGETEPHSPSDFLSSVCELGVGEAAPTFAGVELDLVTSGFYFN